MDSSIKRAQRTLPLFETNEDEVVFVERHSRNLGNLQKNIYETESNSP